MFWLNKRLLVESIPVINQQVPYTYKTYYTKAVANISGAVSHELRTIRMDAGDKGPRGHN